MSAHRGSSRPLLALVAALATLFGLIVTGSPAHAAAPAAPTGLSPASGQSVGGIPALSWNRSSGASSYDVQVATDSDFTHIVFQDGTANHQIVPTTQLPTTQLFWRVTARNGSGSATSTESFVRANVGAPNPVSPVNAVLKEPDNPPVLKWSPVPGAVRYNVQISTDSSFTGKNSPDYSTRVSSLVVPDLRLATDYYWRVQADLGNGLTTAYSSAAKYTLQGLSAPTLVGPTDDITANVQDVVLDWNPVPGAATYDLQVSTDANFLTVVNGQNGIVGTRWSPQPTLNNDQYYWRVRPVDANGNNLDWSQVAIWHFRRNWPDQPQLQYPLHNTTVGDPMYYQWSPVPHASSYALQLSTTPDFSNIVGTCNTVDTTLTGSTNRSCMPTDQGVYWWRVQAIDSPRGVVTDTISPPAQVNKFTYSSAAVSLVSPSNGASSVSVPTLRWSPVAGAAQYRVTVTDTAGGSFSADTTGFSYTPRNVLTAGHTYRWQVQTITGDGRASAGLLLGGQRTFTVGTAPAGSASSPEPTNNPAGSRFPTLTWTPVANADSYRLYVRPSGGAGYQALGTSFGYAAGEDLGSGFLAPGTYDWIVEAYQGNNLLDQSHTIGHFIIAPYGAVLNGRAAITGNAITGKAGTTIDSCPATLPDTCQNLRQEPVLMWDADPDVAFYKLYFSNDDAFTNPIGQPIVVHGNMWADTSALPDSQAGSAYYWEAIPCRTNGACAPLQHAEYAFNKKSNQIVLHPAVSNSPGTCATSTDICNDVTLSWDDFLSTEQNPGSQATTTVLGTPATTGPRGYRLQVSTDPNFQNFLENVDVDQNTFTSTGTTYPEGPIYWRVQAYDGASNPLAFSQTPAPTQANPCPPSWCFIKRSPAPNQLTPASGSTVTGTQPFVWDAQKFARSYDLEVYRNNDTIGQPANLVVNASGLAQAAFSPGDALQPSSTPYTWRVRRRDANGRPGPWSPLTPFSVTGTAPTLLSPGPGAGVAPSDGLFTWGAVDQAATYRFERRVANANVVESRDTPALGYAPTGSIDGGNWQWRVSAIDSNGQVMASSAWRDFSVLDHPVAVTPVTIVGSGAVGTVLTAQAPGWNVPGVSTTYQWMRGTDTIGGATGTVYTVTTQDVGKSLTVVATGTADGYKPGKTQSNAITGGAGNAPSPTVLPSISGTHKVGDTVTANPGTWPGSPSYQYQWLRGGAPIQGATNSSYLLGTGDATAQISVRVTATVNGYAPGTATSAPITVAKMLSSTTAAFKANPIKKKDHAKLTVTVAVPNVARPTGKIKVFDGKKLLLKATLKSKNKGIKNLELPRLKKGKHKIKVKYLGAAKIAGSKVKVVLQVGK